MGGRDTGDTDATGARRGLQSAQSFILCLSETPLDRSAGRPSLPHRSANHLVPKALEHCWYSTAVCTVHTANAIHLNIKYIHRLSLSSLKANKLGKPREHQGRPLGFGDSSPAAKRVSSEHQTSQHHTHEHNWRNTRSSTVPTFRPQPCECVFQPQPPSSSHRRCRLCRLQSVIVLYHYDCT